MGLARFLETEHEIMTYKMINKNIDSIIKKITISFKSNYEFLYYLLILNNYDNYFI